MKNILILGRGFIGQNLSNYFSKNSVDHEIYSKSMLDYTNVDNYNNFLKENENKYFAVINTSGYTGRPNVDACEANKVDCWNWNVIYPVNITKISNEHKLPVIQINSGCIYNGYDKSYTEEDVPNFGLFSNESSFYSKCKHTCEMLLENNNAIAYIMRIRIPFTHVNEPKNYFTKLLKYSDLIDMENSVTSVTDFNNFIFRFIHLIQDLPGGIYNVCNPEPVKASQVVEIMRKYNMENADWKFIDVKDLQTVANRSNCVLDTKKIESYNLPMPNTLESIERDLKIFKEFYK
jgi:dTDP-4-dehydrorhamnose reductase